MKNIVLFGGGTHLSYCIDIIEKENKYKIVGITDPNHEKGVSLFGYKVIGQQENIKELINEYKIDSGIITIGDNWTRKIVYDKIVEIVPDFDFVSTIHPSVVIGKNVTIGKGTVIMAGCIISPNVKIGEFCFFATGAILEHDSFMDDFSSLSAGSVTGGKVKIGKFSAITLGVTIFDRIEIGEHSVIGSGSLVTKDVPSYVLAYGSPAKIIRKREAGEKYLK
ncbi:MAG: transferase [Bacteroidetes bacterium HGW-Bacteroidetes-12]|nr:MAG: transferase [Bacteroidetes bacterium HGW-Bacteroidetes-12]